MMDSVWLQATAPVTNEVTQVAPYTLIFPASDAISRCMPSSNPVSWKMPEYDEEMQTISITLTMETMPPPSMSRATWASAQ